MNYIHALKIHQNQIWQELHHATIKSYKMVHWYCFVIQSLYYREVGLHDYIIMQGDFFIKTILKTENWLNNSQSRDIQMTFDPSSVVQLNLC